MDMLRRLVPLTLVVLLPGACGGGEKPENSAGSGGAGGSGPSAGGMPGTGGTTSGSAGTGSPTGGSSGSTTTGGTGGAAVTGGAGGAAGIGVTGGAGAGGGGWSDGAGRTENWRLVERGWVTVCFNAVPCCYRVSGFLCAAPPTKSNPRAPLSHCAPL